MSAGERSTIRVKLSVTLTALMGLAMLYVPDSAWAARHWFTEENRYLLKTAAFEASVSTNSYCDPASRDTDVIVSLRFLSPISFEVSENPTYLKFIQEEIAPVVRDICGEVTDLVILNFFAHPLRDHEGAEVPASRATFRNLLVTRYPPKILWVWFDAIFSGAFPPGNKESFGNSRLTTEAAIRSWLSKGTPDQLVAAFRNGQALEARFEEEKQALESQMKALDAEKLQLGSELYDLQLGGAAYRKAIDIFAEACAKRTQGGCYRLDRALAQIEANCNGESKDREAKPLACGLYGYALEKAPILDVPNDYRNIPRTRDPKLISALYREACAAGDVFYCKRH
jgi:hypothetical protein